jgi:uncharacterized protein (DUF2461 family)
MNPMTLMNLAITFLHLNMGQSAAGKKVIKEALDVVQSLGSAMKDNKITMVEKKALIKELREFTKTTIDLIDAIQIPDSGS